MRVPLYVLVLTATLTGTAAFAQGTHLDIDQAPPAPVYEVSPGERPGYTLAPGYWRWDGKRHIWTPSRWVADRPGYSWVPDAWEQHGSKWHFAKGYWADASTGEEVTEDAQEAKAPASTSSPAKTKVKKVKRVKKPDYSNTRIWPKMGRP